VTDARIRFRNQLTVILEDMPQDRVNIMHAGRHFKRPELAIVARLAHARMMTQRFRTLCAGCGITFASNRIYVHPPALHWPDRRPMVFYAPQWVVTEIKETRPWRTTDGRTSMADPDGGPLAQMMLDNAALIEEAIEEHGPSMVAEFFLHTGAAIAALYNVEPMLPGTPDATATGVE
jgi:hypothetical protein